MGVRHIGMVGQGGAVLSSTPSVHLGCICDSNVVPVRTPVLKDSVDRRTLRPVRHVAGDIT
jgi:hypothetical protein